MPSETKARAVLRAVPPIDAGIPASGSRSPVAPRASDEELIAAIARGDDRVAGQLYERLSGVIDRTLYRVFGRRESDHDDLVQSSFEQVVITLSRRRFAGACSLATWASTVASHVGLNALRSRRRERKVINRDEPLDDELALPAPSSLDVERHASARQELGHLREHLAAIDPLKAETLFLHDALGHDLAEVAVLMNVSVAAAQSRLVRGRRELLDRIEAERAGGVG